MRKRLRRSRRVSAFINVYEPIRVKTEMTTEHSINAIVIGASAGGVEAVGQLLASLPADFRPAVLVVLHLPPEGPNALAAVFSRKCILPVKEAEDKENILPGTVYVAPADYHLMVEPDLSLSLSRDEARHYSRPSIDMLFESAALAYREKVLAILLTGANTDGSEGMKQVQECGGCCWVQDPAEALASAMPDAAIRLIVPERILTLQDMAASLNQINRASLAA